MLESVPELWYCTRATARAELGTDLVGCLVSYTTLAIAIKFWLFLVATREDSLELSNRTNSAIAKLDAIAAASPSTPQRAADKHPESIAPSAAAQINNHAHDRGQDQGA